MHAVILDCDQICWKCSVKHSLESSSFRNLLWARSHSLMPVCDKLYFPSPLCKDRVLDPYSHCSAILATSYHSVSMYVRQLCSLGLDNYVRWGLRLLAQWIWKWNSPYISCVEHIFGCAGNTAFAKEFEKTVPNCWHIINGKFLLPKRGAISCIAEVSKPLNAQFGSDVQGLKSAQTSDVCLANPCRAFSNIW